jgi:hypothetical protein
MWITVENTRKSGDSQLGISQEGLEGFKVSSTFPQSSPQLFIKRFSKNFRLIWEEICNYKKVISFTHISTAVITTNFKYKTFLLRVPFSVKETQGAM